MHDEQQFWVPHSRHSVWRRLDCVVCGELSTEVVSMSKSKDTQVIERGFSYLLKPSGWMPQLHRVGKLGSARQIDR